jgi:hypothetical protein
VLEGQRSSLGASLHYRDADWCGSEKVLQKLWAEENLFEDLEIIGLLCPTRMFDISEISLGSREE